MPVLLAIDIGVKTGLALFGHDDRLLWYRSQNFGTAQQLCRGERSMFDTLPHLAWLVLEGGGLLVEIWRREAMRRQILVRQINAEAWRRQFLYVREQRNGAQAKASATELARRIIIWSGARPTSLRDDAAEAMLIGLWGVCDAGWLAEFPDAVRRYEPVSSHAPVLLDPATLKIDARTNPGGRQVLTIQPGSSDSFSAVRVGLCATSGYAVRLRQGFA